MHMRRQLRPKKIAISATTSNLYGMLVYQHNREGDRVRKYAPTETVLEVTIWRS